MKKMVCEICESTSILKEDGVFVCQECGTKYRLEEAKKLLREVLDDESYKSIENKSIETVVNNSEENCDSKILLNQLYLWCGLISYFKELEIFAETVDTTNSELYLTNDYKKVFNFKLSKKYLDLFDGIGDYHYLLYYTFTDYWYDMRFTTFELLLLREQCLSETMFCMHKCQHIDKVVNYGKTYVNRLENFNEDIDYIITQKIYLQIFKEKYNEKFLFEEAAKTYYLFNKNYEFSGNAILLNNEFLPDKDFVAYLKYLLRILMNVKENSNDNFVYKKTGFIIKKEVIFPPEFDWATYSNRVCSFKKELLRNAKNDYNKLSSAIMEKYSKIFDDFKIAVKELENSFFVPYKYRNLQTLHIMIDLLESGQAENWKELANLYDTHQFRESVKLSFNEINERLSNIESLYHETNEHLAKMNKTLTSIKDNLSNISKHVAQISKLTNDIKKIEFADFFEIL